MATTDERITTSFIAYLLDTYGPGPLRNFLSQYDPQRRDLAAQSAYHRPLGTLDSWSMRQKALKKRVLMPFVVRALKRAAAVHYTSTQERQDVEAAFGLSHGVVIPLGVQLTYLNAPVVADAGRADNRYILALSRLHPVKNLEALIDAFCDLRVDGIGTAQPSNGSADWFHQARFHAADLSGRKENRLFFGRPRPCPGKRQSRRESPGDCQRQGARSARQAGPWRRRR